MKKIVLIFTITLFLFGCNKDNSADRINSFIVGEWTYTKTRNGETGKAKYDSNNDFYDWVDGIGETEYQYRGKYEIKTDSIIFSLDEDHDGIIENVITNYYKTNSDKTIMYYWGYLVNVDRYDADVISRKQ